MVWLIRNFVLQILAGIYIKSGEGNGGETWWDSGVIQKVCVFRGSCPVYCYRTICREYRVRLPCCYRRGFAPWASQETGRRAMVTGSAIIFFVFSRDQPLVLDNGRPAQVVLMPAHFSGRLLQQRALFDCVPISSRTLYVPQMVHFYGRHLYLLFERYWQFSVLSVPLSQTTVRS